MKYLNALNKISGVGPQKIRILLNHFKTPENAWKANLSDLKASKLQEKIAERIVSERDLINPDEEWEKLEKHNIQMLTLENSDFPKLLREIPNPPYIIYTKGDMNLNAAPLIAIVGSRKYSSYGSQIAESFGRDLVQAGMIVVSGMAIGIDTFAHRGALRGKGKTVAILGNSLEDASIYPRINFNLSREIIENGMLLSEYPVETSAGPLTFPARNRIIAGITLGTLVIEAGEKSGALITSQMALEFNREVFSVPGSIFSPESLGTNELIKKGARMVTGVKDILEELDLSFSRIEKTTTPRIPENKEEELLLKTLSSDPIHIDTISKITKLETFRVSSALAMMEIKGWTKNIGGQNYILL